MIYVIKPGGARTTLRVIIFKADLKLDCLKEISLLLLQRVFQKILDVCTHSGCEGSVSEQTRSHYRLYEDDCIPTVILDMARTVFQKNFRFLW